MSEKIREKHEGNAPRPEEKFQNADVGVEYKELKQGETIDVEHEKKRVIVEVGCGSNPYFIAEKEKIKKNEHYIGLDLPEKYMKEPTDEFGEKYIPKQRSWFTAEELKRQINRNLDLIEGKADFIIASGLRIPLKDKSADRIVFTSVLGAPPSFFVGAGFCKSPEELSQLLSKHFVQEYRKQLNPEEQKKLDEGVKEYEEEIKSGKPVSFEGIAWRIEYTIRESDPIRYERFQQWEDLFTRDAKKRLLEEAFRVLKSGGELVVYDHKVEFGNEYSVSETDVSKKFKFERKETLKNYPQDEYFMLIFKKTA